MNQEQKTITQQLKKELAELQFTGHTKVIRRTHPTTWRQKMISWWNKEIELPLLPIGTALAAVIIVMSIIPGQSAPKETNDLAKPRVLVEEGGNIYWEDVYKRAVVRIENQTKN